MPQSPPARRGGRGRGRGRGSAIRANRGGRTSPDSGFGAAVNELVLFVCVLVVYSNNKTFRALLLRPKKIRLRRSNWTPMTFARRVVVTPWNCPTSIGTRTIARKKLKSSFRDVVQPIALAGRANSGRRRGVGNAGRFGRFLSRSGSRAISAVEQSVFFSFSAALRLTRCCSVRSKILIARTALNFQTTVQRHCHALV